MTNTIDIILGFDFGLKRIGVAIGQTVTKSARGLGVIKAQNGEPNWEEISLYLKKWQPQAIIVGIPLNMDGTEQSITKHAKKFAKKCEEKFSLPVFYEDERLTTVEAREQVFQIGGYKALQKKSIDSIAAEIIIKNWLEKNTS